VQNTVCFKWMLTDAGCFTCKDRKKKCDLVYVYDQVSGTTKCTTCRKHGIRCDLERPTEWAVDPAQKQAQQLERKMQVKLGKRKSREESDSSSVVRDRSMTLQSEEEFNSLPVVYPSIEGPRLQNQSHQKSWHIIKPLAEPLRRGAFTAIRGGKGGSKKSRSEPGR
jgi:hypothetical protein